jgi:hypothetical protein
LYGCETWSLTLREERRLRVFENRVLRRIFWPRGMRWRENGGSCTMRNFIICTHPQTSLGKSSQGEWGGRGRWHAWERIEKCLVEKPEGKRPLGRPRRRWEDGIRRDLGRLAWGGVVWIRLSQDRDRWRAVVSAVLNLRVLAPRS